MRWIYAVRLIVGGIASVALLWVAIDMFLTGAVGLAAIGLVMAVLVALFTIDI